MACSEKDASSSTSSSPSGKVQSDVLAAGTASPEKPRRNLTQEFALCLDKTAVVTEGLGLKSDATPSNSGKAHSVHASIFSPTTVIPTTAVQHSPVPEKKLPLYPFKLHASLKRGLSQATVDRVFMHEIIHDINKEALTMSANDPKQPVFEETKEESSCPLVQAAVNDCISSADKYSQPECSSQSAIIDDEGWLLDIVAARDPEERKNTTCPPTFLQAMGEKEYENPVQALSGPSRTQLWKPSRSWWEAKSGKNPWIEPSSHNKRWR